MKPLKIILTLTVTLFLSISCNKEIVTYNFINDDQSKLLHHYTIGKIFTFVNHDGDERQFEVVNVEHKIIQECKSSGISGPRYYFYYEKKNFELKDFRNENYYNLIIQRYPKDILAAKNNIYKKFPSYLFLKIESYGIDGYHDGMYDYYGMMPVEFSFEEEITTLTINSITYKRVHILFREEDCSSGGTFNEAKYTYYDEDHGFIGFDTYDGHEWRLRN